MDSVDLEIFDLLKGLVPRFQPDISGEELINLIASLRHVTERHEGAYTAIAEATASFWRQIGHPMRADLF